MTAHLPECIDYYNSAAQTVPCICPELRACEQRVRHEGLGVCIEHYDAGVQAARDAVAALDPRYRVYPDRFVRVSDALAAIDGLRGSGNPDTPPSAEKGEQA